MSLPSSSNYDVVVIGGGPAGSATAALVAEQGHSVLLLERSATDRFKVGESLMPATYWSLERLGVLGMMKGSRFPVKQSVQFFNQEGRGSAPFYFPSVEPHESSRTWQVLRSEFDAMLLDNAARKGVEVVRGVGVRDVLFDGDRAVGVSLGNGQGNEEIGCRVVVDASGQSALLARKLGLLRAHPSLRNASFYSHFEGAHRDQGVDEGATLILQTADQESWFWYIPMPGEVVSVGVVGPLDYLVGRRERDPQRVFEEELAKCPEVKRRLEGATQIRPMAVIRDFSYRSRDVAGDGWVLVGDAFGFIDPIYSSGVFLALKSGEMAADAILEGLEKDDLSAGQLGGFGPEYLNGMDAIQKLVYAYYDRNFHFGSFLKRFPECRDEIVHILIGNVYRHSVEDLFEPLARFRREAATVGAT